MLFSLSSAGKEVQMMSLVLLVYHLSWVLRCKELLQDCGIQFAFQLMAVCMRLVGISLGSWVLVLIKLRYIS